MSERERKLREELDSVKFIAAVEIEAAHQEIDRLRGELRTIQLARELLDTPREP